MALAQQFELYKLFYRQLGREALDRLRFRSNIILLLLLLLLFFFFFFFFFFSITAVFLEYLRQLLIDLHQTYRHSSVPKNTSPYVFGGF